MTLNEFAKESGVIIGRCDKSWGGTFSYTIFGQENVSFCGYKTENAALNGWLADTFGQHTVKAIKKLLKQSEAKK